MTTQPMTPEQHRAYAADLLREQATEIDALAISECAGDSPHVPGDEISQADCDAVYEQMRAAQVAITWPDRPREISDELALAVASGRGCPACAADPDDCPLHVPVRADQVEALPEFAVLLDLRNETGAHQACDLLAAALTELAAYRRGEVTARPAAEQAEPTTTAAPVEIGVHQLALAELAIQVYAIAHDVDPVLVSATDPGVPEILAVLEAYEAGFLGDVATVLDRIGPDVQAANEPTEAGR